MTKETKKLKDIIICLVNGRKKDEDIRRIYNFVIGIVHRELDEQKKRNLSSRVPKKEETNERPD